MLERLYPTGEINWGDSSDWKIGVPGGRGATFCLRVTRLNQTQAGFTLYYPRVFVGVDVYNSSDSGITLKIHSPQNADVLFTVPAGKLEELRTGWIDRTTRVSFEAEKGTTLDNLMFDDLAYTEATPVTPGPFAATLP